MLPSPLRHWQGTLPIGRKRDPLPIRRPRRPEIASWPRRERLRPVRLHVENPKVSPPASPRRHEDDLPAVRRVRGLIFKGWVIREPLQPAAVDLHAIQIRRSVALGGERDPLPVRRPCRIVIESPMCQPSLPAPVCVRDEQARLRRAQARKQNPIGRRAAQCRDAYKNRRAYQKPAEPHGSPSSIRITSGPSYHRLQGPHYLQVTDQRGSFH